MMRNLSDEELARIIDDGEHVLAEDGPKANAYARNVLAVGTELRERRAESARLRELLREIEWITPEQGVHLCPWCHRGQYDGHQPGCGLAAALDGPAPQAGSEVFTVAEHRIVGAYQMPTDELPYQAMCSCRARLSGRDLATLDEVCASVSQNWQDGEAFIPSPRL